MLLVARRGDLAVSGPEWERHRKEESAENSKPGKVVSTSPAQRVGLGGKDTGRGVLATM